MVRIKRNSPVSLDAKPPRAIRRLCLNPVFRNMDTRSCFDMLFLSISTLTVSMLGMSLGFFLRFAGL